jgi:hypothetical protein
MIDNAVEGTATLDEKPDPLHFWQSVQWHRAVIAGSPTEHIS